MTDETRWYQGEEMTRAIKVAAARIVAWVRAEAENKDYATACEWRSVADAIEREADEDEHLWLCECRSLNADHEAFCYRCGAGQPEGEEAR